MTVLTLPGSIPGLRRRGSPVAFMSSGTLIRGIWTGETGVAVKPRIRRWIRPDQWELDLTDPTGRVHAAWWAASIQHPPLPQGEETELAQFCVAATASPLVGFWSDVHIARFRKLCKKLAGVTGG